MSNNIKKKEELKLAKKIGAMILFFDKHYPFSDAKRLGEIIAEKLTQDGSVKL